MKWPAGAIRPPAIMTALHTQMAGSAIAAAAGSRLFGPGSATLPTGNLAIFYPFRLATFETAYQLLVWLGGTVNGNVMVGIYDSEKHLIVSAGPTAVGTANAVQALNITDTPLPPGRYLLAIAASSGTCQFMQDSNTDTVSLVRSPTYEQAGLTAGTLTDPAVPVLATQASPSVVAVGIQFVPIF